MNPEIALFNEPIRPNQREEFRFADHLASAFDKNDEYIEGTRAKLHRYIVTGQNTASPARA